MPVTRLTKFKLWADMRNTSQKRFGGAKPGNTSDLFDQSQASLIAELAALSRAERDDPDRFDPRETAEKLVRLPGVSLASLTDATWALLESWPAQDQGRNRSTCVPFAVLAMIELRERLSTAALEFPNYSEEFLYAKMRVDHQPTIDAHNYNSGSTFLDQAADALIASGVCDERTMPYDTGASRPDYTQVPTDNAKSEAATRKFPVDSFQYLRLRRKDPAEWRGEDINGIVRRELKAGNPVVASFPIYYKSNSWTNFHSDGWKYGEIQDPSWPAHIVDVYDAGIATESVLGGHAVCIVGTRPGSGINDERFVFRNSWGNRFARAYDKALIPPPRAGYGTISGTHLQNHCWELLYVRRNEL